MYLLNFLEWLKLLVRKEAASVCSALFIFKKIYLIYPDDGKNQNIAVHLCEKKIDCLDNRLFWNRIGCFSTDI